MSLRLLILLNVATWVSALAYAAPDVLVVCPVEYRDALEPWVLHRTGQGREIALVAPPQSFDVLQQVVRTAADGGRLRYVVLVGDAPPRGSETSGPSDERVPTGYATPTVNVRWGSPPHLATDLPLADVDGDGLPDLAVGRLPVNSAAELENVVRKTILSEQSAESGQIVEQINVVAGVGGFGRAIDAVIEAAARKLISDHVPAHYTTQLAHANPRSKGFPGPQQFRADVRALLTQSSRAWIYLGHGHVNTLDVLATEGEPLPMLAVGDLSAAPLDSPTSGHPLAVMLACYTGAFDAPIDCLAERILVQPGGPVAVLAATRVSMPYGNCVFGYELLRATFGDQYATLGETYLVAQQRTLGDGAGDAARTSLDQLARGLLPAAADLAAERREHVQMYHLLGDPLLRMPVGERELRIAEGPDRELAR